MTLPPSSHRRVRGFGPRLQSLRESAKESRRTLARAIGTHPASIVRWETGDGLPHAELLAEIAVHYGVSVDHLLLGESVAAPSIQPQLRGLVDALKACVRAAEILLGEAA